MRTETPQAPARQRICSGACPFFVPEYDRNVTRAHAVGDEIVHFEKPVHYGDSVSNDGSLVFTDFGWEFFEQLSHMFGSVEIELFHSWQYGHLGSNLFFFRCRP